MFGSGKEKGRERRNETNLDVAALFFDRFSQRVTTLEESLRDVSKVLDRLKANVDRSQVSDLVLLERIQRSDALLEDSLSWTKKLVELITAGPISRHRPMIESASSRPHESEAPVRLAAQLRPIVSLSGEQDTALSSITTSTELQVLSLLAERGPMPAPMIGKEIGRSREHTARLMKRLYQEGYVNRDQSRVPFRYALVDRIRQGFKVEEALRSSSSRKDSEAGGSGAAREAVANLPPS